MDFYKLLQTSDIEPEDKKRMGIAFEMALRHLLIKDRDGEEARTLGSLIIQAAKTEEEDPEAVCRVAVASLER